MKLKLTRNVSLLTDISALSQFIPTLV